MDSLFDYDVFLSFASTDMEAAKDIWQVLIQGGLGVFWSPITLKEKVGQSYLAAIQEGLVKSQHFVLYWTAGAKASNPVEAEYQAFYSQCHLKDKGSRRLISLVDAGEPISSLPPFLQSLQITSSVRELVSLLGGIDPRKLQQANRELRHQVERLREENLALQARHVNLDRQKDPEAERLKAQLGDIRQELALAKQRLDERPASPSPRSYSTLKWDNPKPSPTGDLSLCFKTGEELAQPLQQYAYNSLTVLRFFLARPNGSVPIDVTVSFQGKMVYSGRAVTRLDEVYITAPIRTYTTYRFTVHLDQPQEPLSHATIDANTHEIEMVACSVLACPDGHEWSDTSFKFCPRDGKPLSDT